MTDILGSFMDHRHDGAPRRDDSALIAWLSEGRDPAQRLLAFDSWIRAELRTRFPELPQRQIEAARVELENLVLELWKRGWMLDGRKLAKHIQAALDDVAKAKQAGRVKEFWPFFKSVVNRYVGLNAEEIQVEAKSAGALMSQVLSIARIGKPILTTQTTAELLAQRKAEIQQAKTLREKLAIARAQSKKPDPRQPELL